MEMSARLTKVQLTLVGTADFARDRKLIVSKFGKPENEIERDEQVAEGEDQNAEWVMEYNTENPRAMLNWLLDDCHLPSVTGLYVVR